MRPTALPLALLLCVVASSAMADSLEKTLSEVTTDGKSCSQKADIFFAIDSSHSVGRTNFNTVKKFIHEIVSKLLRKSTNFRFGFVVFSDKADMVVKLKDYSMSKSKERVALLRFILSDIVYKSGKTVTGEAFQLIREQGFKEINGHRKDAKPVVVLLTDGRANGRADPVQEAKKLRGVGASVVAVGIGTGISRKRLEAFSNQKRYVTVVKDFSDLSKVSRVITKTLCDGGAKAEKLKECDEGLELVAGRCVPEKPKCTKKCPKGYVLVYPCKCIPNLDISSSCKVTCKETEILVKGCKCVPRKSSSTEKKKAKKCTKKCRSELTLNKKLCKCVCRNKCSGSNFEQNSDCSCVCKMRCRQGFALNRKTCTCNRVECKPGFEFFDGKCRPKVRKFCKSGQVLYRDICIKGDCPKGYKKRSNRKCYKYDCKIGYKRAKDGKCVKKCTGKKYYYKKSCHSPKKCGLHEYFEVNSPGCQRTCNEPVLISKCPKERAPQCVCQPYFLRHKGKCIHPSDCPNIPICIQKADVIFMLDSSLTVSEHNFYLMKNFVRDVVQQFYLKSGDRQRVGILKFNHKADIVLDLDSWQHRSHEKILKKIEKLEFQPGLTFLGEALHKVRTKMWNKLAGMRTDVPRVTILLTDGADTNGEVDPLYEAKKLRQSGSFFVTIAIGKAISRNKKQFVKLAGPEGRVFFFGLREFQDLHSLVARVLSFHCEKPLCPRPYLIRGHCVRNYKSITRVEYVPEEYRCRKVVKKKFKRERCACPKPSVSSGPCTKMFKKVTTTYYTLNKKKGVCESKSRDDEVRCGCPKSSRVVGKCNKQFRTIEEITFKLVKGGSKGFTCKRVVKKKLRRCACSKPIRKYEKCINNFKVMHETRWEFEHSTRGCIRRRRTKEIRCSCPKPSVETGHCNGKFVPIKIYTQKVNKKNQCDDIMWTGSAKCERKCTKNIDLAFIVDSSDSVRGVNFEYIRRFIVAVAKKLDVSRDNTHIALLKYSSINKMKIIFNYIAHYSFASIKARVMQMRYSPGTTFTGDALYNFRRFLLDKINGFRDSDSSTQHVAILVTDGASNSKINATMEANRIKAMGVKIVTVGVGEDIESKQLSEIATEPSGIHSFKTSSFNDLTDPAFVEEVIGSMCRVGKVNKVSVKSKYKNKIRDYMARGVNVDWTSWGFEKVNPKDLAQFSFKVKGSYVEVIGDSKKKKSRFLNFVRISIAKRLRIHPYSIRKLYVSRKMEVTGLLKDSKMAKLKELVVKKALKIKTKDSEVLVDETSFKAMPHATLEVVRKASEAADIVLSVIRPQRRLVKSAETAVPLIKRKDVKKLAEKELLKIKTISTESDDVVDKLIALSNKARVSKDQKIANKCLKSFRVVMAASAKVTRHIGYIAYFSRKGTRDTLKRRIEKVSTRIANAYSEIGIAEKAETERKASESKAAPSSASSGKKLAAAPSGTKKASAAAPSGTKEASAAAPSGTKKASAAAPSGTKKASAAAPSGTKKASAAAPSGTKKASAAAPSGTKKASAAAPSGTKKASAAASPAEKISG